MDQFCTNCGHSNSSTDQICIECGSPFTKEPKKPMPFKTKLIAGIAIVLLASIIGLYTWGTNTASAETTVSKFFEALQEKDAAALTKYVVLSNGEELTEKEATAFIDLYQNLTSDELNEMAAVEKNGKIAGIFDAHKIMLPAQELSYYFPYEGLELKLNGEKVPSTQLDDGEYIFSDILTGNYEAEFSFKNEGIDFQYPFKLTVDFQDDLYATSIEEKMPIGMTTVQVSFAGSAPIYDTKVLIGDKELALDEYGTTGEIGPLLLDGTSAVKAAVDFPWGSQESEEVALDSEYTTIDFNGLGEETEAEILAQYVLFVEEHIQAIATRDTSVYTTLEKGLLREAETEIKGMKEFSQYFKGSVEEIHLADEPFYLSDGGQTVLIEGAALMNGAYYYGSDSAETEEIGSRFQAIMNYDSDLGKWLVASFDEYRTYDGDFDGEIIEGSKKFFETKGAVAEAQKEETVSEEDLTGEVEQFMNQYNSSSVVAINSGDFSTVSYLISEDGPKWKESADYIDYMYEKGIKEEHLGTTLEKTEEIDETYIKVTTIERYIIHGTEKSSEKAYRSVNVLKRNEDSWLVNELVSTNEI